MPSKVTKESWAKTSIMVRCPSCGKPHRLLVGLAKRPKAEDPEEEPA